MMVEELLGGEGYKEHFILSLRDKGADELYLHHCWEMGKGQTKMRLDLYVVRRMGCSRTKARKAIEMGAIRLNDELAKVSRFVRAGDHVKLLLPYPLPPPITSEDLSLDIIFEDDDLLLVNKRAGMVCHPTLGHRTGTMFQGLMFHFEELQRKGELEEGIRPGIVHRIDADTTGILVIAKNKDILSQLSAQFKEHSITRFYDALVWGDIKKKKGTISYRIGRSLGDQTQWTTFDNEVDGRHAITHYEVRERFGLATLVRCRLETGRTHQIRLHFLALGHPLIGDKQYGGLRLPSELSVFRDDPRKSFLESMNRQALHAQFLAFLHPKTQERLSFQVDFPQDFQVLLDLLREDS